MCTLLIKVNKEILDIFECRILAACRIKASKWYYALGGEAVESKCLLKLINSACNDSLKSMHACMTHSVLVGTIDYSLTLLLNLFIALETMSLFYGKL